MSRRKPKESRKSATPSPGTRAVKRSTGHQQTSLWPASVDKPAPPETETTIKSADITSQLANDPSAPAHLKARGGLSYASTLLALSKVKGLGRIAIARISDALDGELQRIWDMSDADRFDLFTAAKVPTPYKFVEVLQKESDLLAMSGANLLGELELRNIHILPPADIPPRFKDLSDPPRWLFVQGDVEVIYRQPAVALVGTRNPSTTGLKAAGYIARLAAAYPSVVIVSGLAEGIDEEAHKATLQENLVNVAFLGHGILQIFPAKTAWIRETIIDRGGAVVTEYLPNEHYQKAYFVERNRLQAALANIVIPVEANPKGGTAHTIRFAKRLQRQVVGIRWRGVNGILESLEKDGYPIIDIFTNAGSKKLDKLFRETVEAEGGEAYPLSTLEQRIVREIAYRDVRAQDVKRLLQRMRKLAKEI